MNKKTRFKEPLEINIPPDEVLRKLRYLEKNGVPINELIIVLARAYQEHWENIDKNSLPNREVIQKWFVDSGCSTSQARTFQELIRPQWYQKNQHIEQEAPIKKAASRIWEETDKKSYIRRAQRQERMLQQLRENQRRLRNKRIEAHLMEPVLQKLRDNQK